jgi:hypothetical protein
MAPHKSSARFRDLNFALHNFHHLFLEQFVFDLLLIYTTNLRGRVLIQAGVSKSGTNPESLAYIKRKYKVADLQELFGAGGIVGIAEITDCVRRHRSRWFHSPFGWVLASAHALVQIHPLGCYSLAAKSLGAISSDKSYS